MNSSEKVADATVSATETSGETKTSTSNAEPSSTVVKSSNTPSQSHMSSAHNLFSGRPNAGLMCNNLRANPFSVSDNASSSSGILAKPKFSLKPSSFGADTSATGDQSQSGTSDSINPFLRPAKLSYDTEEDSGDGKQTSEALSKNPAVDNPMKTDNEKETDDTSEISSSTEAVSAVPTSVSNASPSNHRSILKAVSTSLSSNVVRVPQASFVFGEALDSRVTNVLKEAATNGYSNEDEPQQPKSLTLEEAADEYKKQQVCLPSIVLCNLYSLVLFVPCLFELPS